jgi:uncharacterized protein (UPF0147 family)
MAAEFRDIAKWNDRTLPQEIRRAMKFYRESLSEEVLPPHLRQRRSA